MAEMFTPMRIKLIVDHLIVPHLIILSDHNLSLVNFISIKISAKDGKYCRRGCYVTSFDFLIENLTPFHIKIG